MNIDVFDFDLPKELIAQHPPLHRDESRLININKSTKTFSHHLFYEIVDFLKPGDVLVRNNTKVIPSRLWAKKELTGADVEVLLLKDLGQDTWECLLGNAKVVKPGARLSFLHSSMTAECLEKFDEGIAHLKFDYTGVFLEILDEIGAMPLPPYIKEPLIDKERYQTIYAQINGSAAAPTAGFHFTQEIFQKIIDKGITILDLTLHIGLATFRPVKVNDILEHKMHREDYEISQEVADYLNKAKADKRRIIAIGTTSTRALEANYQKYHKFFPTKEATNIFIYPGYIFKAIDGLITNFHLPKSTLIMMVAAFMGLDFTKSIYQDAILNHYRFFSFGDSMFIHD